LQYWQPFQAVYDGLVAFKQVSGPQSFTVVPDLATALPGPTDGGKTYVFTLRKGIKFSDGREVTVDDVVASFQRIFKVSSPTAGSFYNVIVGADACLKKPATCTLAGGVVGDAAASTITFHLTAPDSEFLYKLGRPARRDQPEGRSEQGRGTKPIPSTGAYMIKSYDPNKSLIFVRNPYFKEWSRDAQPEGYPDTIEYDFGQTVEAAVTAVENGQADWIFDPATRGPAGRDRQQVPGPGARRVADRVFLPAAERQHPAVQQPPGPPGGELGARPERASQDLRRPEPRPAGLHDPAPPASPATRTPAGTRSPRAASGRVPTWRRPSSWCRPPAPPGRRSR
jgi:ABC-type transport system substrate-binding protein